MPFTPVESLVGGMMVGSAAALAIVIDGKIMGISGILGPFLRSVSHLSPRLWQGLYILGLVIAGLVSVPFSKDHSFPPAMQFSVTRYVIAGILVGSGTRLGAGCTSGHGICGLARLSPRSFLAVCTFMGVAGGVVAITRHGLQLDTSRSSGIEPMQWPPAWEFTLGAALSAAALAGLVLLVPNPRFRLVTSPLSCGIISGLGLTVSGMTSQYKVLGFLDIGGYWDPSLAFVMGGGLCVTFPTFFFWVDRPNSCPLVEGATFEAPSKAVGLDWNTAKLVVGASLFGVGWGLCGICPGPGVVAVLPYLIQGSAGGGLEANLSLGAFFVFLCVAWLGCDVTLRRAAAPTLPLSLPVAVKGVPQSTVEAETTEGAIDARVLYKQIEAECGSCS